MSNTVYYITELELVEALLLTHGKHESKQEQAAAIVKKLKVAEEKKPEVPPVYWPGFI